jgi:hypothetical protein
MPSPFQQQALQRKFIYMGLIVALLTTAGFFRYWVVDKTARELSLLEQSYGEVEVSGSALRLALTGSRGIVVCALWNWAIDAQKKNRWNELELYVRSLTKLQPHFISSWLFQCWNLSYNVSVESDQVKDKYFFIAEGIKFLAEGERQNRNNPNLRFHLGFFQKNKICQSDETNYFRCLWQMSCIRPPDRDPARFEKEDAQGKMVFDLAQFEKFCQEHPQLVRRLRQKLRCEKPKSIVDFLKENQRIPTLYVDNKEEAGLKWRQGEAPLKPLPDRFPVLPPKTPQDPQELNYEEIGRLTDEFDAFTAARAWYRYAQEPLPPMDPDLPGLPKEITDHVKERLPPFTVAIFRLQPALVQNFIGDRLEQEGWFDTEGWLIPDWFPGNRFPASGKEARVGADRHWASEAWSKAFEMWQQLGQETHLYLHPREESRMKELARRYYEKLGLSNYVTLVPFRPDLKPGDPEYEEYRAARFMYLYFHYRQMTNFSNHYHRTEVEAKPEVVHARRAFYEADQLRLQARRDQALRRYEAPDALEAWRQILDKYNEFRQESNIQEDSFELQVKYLTLVKDLRGRLFKHLLGVEDGLVQGALPPGPAGTWPALIHLALANNWPMPDVQPEAKRRLDSPGSDGKPLIGSEAVDAVLIRRGLKKAPQMPNDPGMMGGGPQPQGILPVPLAAPK